jgi:Arc/MetJ-type ribon-helix-helix transcriptional regulator
MQVKLTPELERQVNEAVAAGRFADPTEAVAEGLRQLFADQDAEADLPLRLSIVDSPDGSVPATVAAALDRGAEDVRLGRTEAVSVVLARMDAKISAYIARRDDSIAR